MTLCINLVNLHICGVVRFLILFFFKQKTAYEMRISDWSSDVCSSDLALGLDPTPRAVVWTFMLSAMGLACIINSRRCGRTHCRFTGPFLIVMAILVIGHTIGRLPLGRFGWPILGATTFAGFVALWSG